MTDHESLDPGPLARADYEALTRVRLMQIATMRAIRGRSRLRKAELVDALLSYDGASDETKDDDKKAPDQLTPSADDAPDQSTTVQTKRPGMVIEISDLRSLDEAQDVSAGTSDAAPNGTARSVGASSSPPKDEPDVAEAEPAPSTTAPSKVAALPAPIAAHRRRQPTDSDRQPRTKRIPLGTLYLRDDTALPLPGRWVFALMTLYVVLNRIISDRFVLPLGTSIRLYEVVLVLVGIAWVLWMVTEPQPMPYGLPALTGLVLVVLVGVAPFVHGPTLNSYQANGAERGLFRMIIFTMLFLAAYHLAFRIRAGLAMLAVVVAGTVLQAGFAIYEKLTAEPVRLLDSLASSIGLVADPLSVRLELDGGVFQRLSGDLRAVATAPHPIVLSAVIAVGILVAGVWLLHTNSTKTKGWLGLAAGVMVMGLPMANSRTGFVIIAVLAIPLTILLIDRIPSIITWSVPLVFALGTAFALSPETPRLLLNSFTDPSADPNTVVRLERFQRLPELLEPRPFLGAGYLTHDPQIQFFDNAFNLTLIELGIAGLAAVVVFILASVVRSWTGSVHAGRYEAVLPIAGVIGGLALLAGGATFDAWNFDQFFPTCLILLGLGLGRSAVILRRNNQDPIDLALPPPSRQRTSA